MPSLTAGPDDVYRAAYPRLIATSRQYFQRFPEDRHQLAKLVDLLNIENVVLSRGDRLTPRRLQSIGIGLGLRDGFDAIHFLIEHAFPYGTTTPAVTDAFLSEVDRLISFAGQPLFGLLHEPLYCQGEASRWSAHRLRDEFSEIDDGDDATFFTGEMVYPWMFEADPALRPFADAAHLLAEKQDWPQLYDTERLKANWN